MAVARRLGSWTRCLLATLALGTAAPAVAQAPPPDPPYQAQMQRLAEILGALHYLRPLCGGKDEDTWREQMQALIAAEEPTPERKAKLVVAFNHGYSGFEALYRYCTPAAVVAIDRYMAEGSQITRDITTRYGR